MTCASCTRLPMPVCCVPVVRAPLDQQYFANALTLLRDALASSTPKLLNEFGDCMFTFVEQFIEHLLARQFERALVVVTTIMLVFGRIVWLSRVDKKRLCVVFNATAELLKHWARATVAAGVGNYEQHAYAIDVAASFAALADARGLPQVIKKFRNLILIFSIHCLN